MKQSRILSKFEEHGIPKKNKTLERHIFLYVPTTKQTIDQYVTELKTLNKNCILGT